MRRHVPPEHLRLDTFHLGALVRQIENDERARWCGAVVSVPDRQLGSLAFESRRR